MFGISTKNLLVPLGDYSSISKPWGRIELINALEQLGEQQMLKFCLFIDGLDKYEGEHLDTAQLLKDIGFAQSIKIQILSQPWNVSQRSFGLGNSLKLVLEEHVEDDIRWFVKGRLKADSSLLNNKADGQSGVCNELTQKIIENARGVFLWVKLVVNGLLRRITMTMINQNYESGFKVSHTIW